MNENCQMKKVIVLEDVNVENVKNVRNVLSQLSFIVRHSSFIVFFR